MKLVKLLNKSLKDTLRSTNKATFIETSNLLTFSTKMECTKLAILGLLFLPKTLINIKLTM